MKASSDSDLVTALEGHGEVLADIQLHCIRRDGYLLLALPRDVIAAKATLGLYNPQAMHARLLVRAVCIMIQLGVHVFLPKLQLTVRASSPLALMLKRSDSVGFLLGNPEAASRRAIIVYREDNQLLVDKLGFCGDARTSVIKELKTIKKLPKENVALPFVVSQDIQAQWASYATQYRNGRSPRQADEEKVLGVLQNWLENSQPQILGETKQWQEMADYAEVHSVGDLWLRLEKSFTKQIQVGLFHGDFAPWNIKVSRDGIVDVLDWEFGCPNGPAGWDWLHYIIQQATLVKHQSASKVLANCHAWATSYTGKEFLYAAGWGDDVKACLGSYLMYSAWIGGFEREELLEEWKKR